MDTTLLSKNELRILKRLNTPQKVQDFLDAIPFNFEEYGDTFMSPRRVLRERKAHCLEGALLAACALSLQGRKPYILSLKVTKDDWAHALALFKENGYWGAISKTNHGVLRYRDPLYKTIRELVLSYFHEYYLVSTGEKTLRGYSKPVDVHTFGKDWIIAEEELEYISDALLAMKHTTIVPENNKRHLRKASLFERRIASIPEWEK